MRVDLVFDGDCPNIEAARQSIKVALAQAGMPVCWKEWERASAQTPENLRAFGSPAVLVNGVDVAGATPIGSACCRLYSAEDGRVLGAPSPEMVGRALRYAKNHQILSSRWRRPLPVLAAAGVSLLPKLACPACWPAYAGLLSSIGLGGLALSKYLFPLTAVFLAIALFSLAYRPGKRRGFAPFWLGLIASGTILGGKFVVESDALIFGGVSILVVASFWNSWPRAAAVPGRCPACAPGRAGLINEAHRRFRHDDKTEN